MDQTSNVQLVISGPSLKKPISALVLTLSGCAFVNLGVWLGFCVEPVVADSPVPTHQIGSVTSSNIAAEEAKLSTQSHQQVLAREAAEDKVWRAQAKRLLPVSANPLPADRDKNKGLKLKNFSDYPLFGSDGPSEDDVREREGGDCGFMAELAGLAAFRPDFIKKIVNDVGDGTYVVHYWRRKDHQQFTIRVNAELWVDEGGNSWSVGNSWYTGITAHHAIWPAILEKAYALTRKPPHTYEAISSDAEWGSDFYIPISQSNYILIIPNDPTCGTPELFPPKVVADWFNHGSPKGPIWDAIQDYAVKRLTLFKALLDAREPVVVEAWGPLRNDTPLIPPDPVQIEKKLPRTDTYRSNHQHIFLVESVQTNSSGKPVAVVLNNVDALRITLDYARVYFFLGRAFSVHPEDSIKFVPPSSLH